MPTTDEIVSQYIAARNEVEEVEARHKAELIPVKEKLEGLSFQLLEICNENNADSIKTPMGTVSRRVSSRFWTTDWERMYEFITKNEAPFLLEQRIHNGNMRQFMEENPDQMPIGLQSTSKYVIQVRKPTNK